MNAKEMIFLFLLLVPHLSFQQQSIGAPQLDCSRVHPSFCCTSRIRSLCPNECSTVPCGPEYYQRLFSTDLNSGSSSRDGSSAPRVIAGDSQVIEGERQEPPEDTVIVDVTTAKPVGSTFPTLIPFEPNIDEVPSQDKEIVWTTPQPVVNQIPKKGKTPDPRIIRPPDASLVLIGDYEDGDDTNVQAAAGAVPTALPMVSSSGVVTVPSSFIAREEFINSATLSRTVPASVQSEREFNVGLARNGHPPRGVETPNFSVDGVAAKSKITRGIASILSQFKFTPSASTEGKVAPDQQTAMSGTAVMKKQDFLPFRQPQPAPRWQQPPPQTGWQQQTPPPVAPQWQQPPPGWQQPGPPQSWQQQTPPPQPAPVWQQTPAPQLPPAWQQPPPQPAAVWQQTPPPQTCGVGPMYTPCVPSEVASSKLLDCCRQKNLPPGCQSLCRYDITQKEVRAAFDRGQCGLFHVAPFLECAAQGKDNTECCQVKGVPQKSGPQCLQFCRPQGGITALGLQHVVCGNAIGEMLHCHHSGIRP